MFEAMPSHEEVDLAAHLQHLGWADLAPLVEQEHATAAGIIDDASIVGQTEAIFDTEGLLRTDTVR